MTLETLLSEVYDRGWYVYSIRDCGDGRLNNWECSLRYEAGQDSLISYGQGGSLIYALSIAIDRIPDATPHQPDKPTYSIETKPALSAILANLLPKQQKINRRL